LTGDSQWFDSDFNPATVKNMPLHYFIMISKIGALGLGVSLSRMAQERRTWLRDVDG
jgi:hypothetical protein